MLVADSTRTYAIFAEAKFTDWHVNWQYYINNRSRSQSVFKSIFWETASMTIEIPNIDCSNIYKENWIVMVKIL